MAQLNKIELSFAHVFEFEKGVIYTFFKDNKEIDIVDAEKLDNARLKINGDTPFYSLVNIEGVLGSVSTEAQIYWAKHCQCAKLIKFEAIIIKSLPARIVTKNYVRQFKPLFEIKIYKNEKLALAAIRDKMKNEA